MSLKEFEKQIGVAILQARTNSMQKLLTKAFIFSKKNKTKTISECLLKKKNF